MKKRLLAVCAALVAVVFFSVSSVLAAQPKPGKSRDAGKPADAGARKEAPEYKTFRLSTKKISIGISQEGKTLDPMAVLQLPESLSKEQGIRNAALAMAIGYCTFLELTKLPEDLKAAGADDALASKIMRGENVNQWLATAWQESAFEKNVTQSGYYQIDNPPSGIVGNMWGVERPYYLFLEKLPGGTDYNSINKPWKPNEPLPPLTKMDERGFVWSSVEKGYYEAISYIRNKNGMVSFYSADGGTGDPVKDFKPYPGFSFAGWAVKYAKTIPATKHPYPVDGEQAPGELQAYNGFGMVMAYMYNRGQFPFLNYYHYFTQAQKDEIRKAGKAAQPPWTDEQIENAITAAVKGADRVRKACQYITDAFGKNPDDVPALDKICKYDYNKKGDPSDPVWWGSRYIWQLGWLNAMLNECETVYDEKIILKDVESVLNILKGFYSSGDTANDATVQAGINEARKLTWDYRYNSPETFENILAVTKAMMENSRKEAE